MLPDYYDIKQKIQSKIIDKIIKNRSYGILFDKVGQNTIFEGNKIKMIRCDGTEDETIPQMFSSKFEIKKSEFENMSFEDIKKKFSTIGENLGEQKSKYFFDKIGKVAESVGNSFNFSGEILSAKHIFSIFKKIQFDFNSKGEPILPTLLTGKEFQNKVIEIVKQIENDPELSEEWKNIINIKRSEWLDRESSRTLVG